MAAASAAPTPSNTATAVPLVTEGRETNADRAACTGSGLQEALDSYGWVVHVGPFSVGSDGVEVRPQLKFGGQVGNVSAEVGVSDLRDGLRFDSGVKAFAEAEGAGHSLEEVHASVRQKLGEKAASLGSAVGRAASSERVDEVLNAAGRILSSSTRGLGSRTDEIARALGIDTSELDRMLSGEVSGDMAANSSQPSDRPPMTLKVRASTGLNVSCQMCFGWCDTKGYHMVGLGAKATAVVSAGGNVFAGRHSSGVGIKIILGIGNFTLEYTFPCATTRREKSQAILPDSTGSQEQTAPAGTTSEAGVANSEQPAKA